MPKLNTKNLILAFFLFFLFCVCYEECDVLQGEVSVLPLYFIKADSEIDGTFVWAFYAILQSIFATMPSDSAISA